MTAKANAESVAAEWKLCGHLFLALEKCECSAGWLLSQFTEDPEVFEIYDKARIEVQKKFPVPPDCASDMEVALLFHYWPTTIPTIAGGIATVAKVWKTTREMTLKSWLRRIKFDGPQGPISAAVLELREARGYMALDLQESLWMTDPQLAARLHIASLPPPKPKTDVIETVAELVNGVPRSISDGSLMRGIQ